MSGQSPDFIVPGASKSGTTSLFYYLDEHEEVFLPEGKELHFFDRNGNYAKGLAHYESRFEGARRNQVAGEVTPSYFYAGKVFEENSYRAYVWDPDDDVPSRIAEAYPDVKLVFTLRNPITRAHSQFWKNYRQGRERADSLGEAVEEELADERDPTETPFCWVYNNRYSVHLERWFDLFDREQIRVLVFEEWIDSPAAALDDVCAFLGVEPRESWSRTGEPRNVGGTPRFVGLNRVYQDYVQGTALATALKRTGLTHALDALNSSEGYPEMTAEDRRLVTDALGDEVAAVEELLGRDLDVWREELAA